MAYSSKIGFMQGRLSPMINNCIQAFPWRTWRDEFSLAHEINLNLMEWTLDQKRLYENPLLTKEGQAEIKNLCQLKHILIPSLTGDCFMQAPLWKYKGAERLELEKDFIEIAKASVAIGISMIIIPLVDNGRLENMAQEDDLVNFLDHQSNFLSDCRLMILFESDYKPNELARFIGRLDPLLFGVNYDIGNSAALGFKVEEEFLAYGERIINVHIKDRLFEGTTVPLGAGSADFNAVFRALSKINYNGNYILQTARAKDSNDAEVLSVYRDMSISWLENL
jgi:L-ribulose-5-phosphate 3-epimerase